MKLELHMYVNVHMVCVMPLNSVVEHQTFNLRVMGSNPVATGCVTSF